MDLTRQPAKTFTIFRFCSCTLLAHQHPSACSNPSCITNACSHKIIPDKSSNHDVQEFRYCGRHPIMQRLRHQYSAVCGFSGCENIVSDAVGNASISSERSIFIAPSYHHSQASYHFFFRTPTIGSMWSLWCR